MKTNTKIFIKALVDSGNLFGDIILEKLAKIFKIKIKSCEKKVGKAMAGNISYLISNYYRYSTYFPSILSAGI